jgi:hypothetical protein
MTRIILLTSLMLLALASSSAFGQPFAVPWYTVDGGGGHSEFGNLELDGTIGQHDASGPLTGGSFALTGGFWRRAAAAGGPVCANGGTLIEGAGQQNNFNATCGSDNVRWAAHGAVFAFQVSDPVVQFELTTTAPAGAGSISVDVEASRQAGGANLILRAQLFNFVTNSYVAMPGTLLLTTTDQVKNYALPVGSNPADFIEPGTNEVRLLLQTIQTSGVPNVRTQLDEVLFNF